MSTTVSRRDFARAGLALVALRQPQTARGAEDNLVVSYLTGAEFQTETAAQGAELRSALADLATQPVSALRARRYRDYRGRARAWTVVEVLRAYVVPTRPLALESERFFADLAAPEARSVAKQRLAAFELKLKQGK